MRSIRFLIIPAALLCIAAAAQTRTVGNIADRSSIKIALNFYSFNTPLTEGSGGGGGLSHPAAVALFVAAYRYAEPACATISRLPIPRLLRKKSNW